MKAIQTIIGLTVGFLVGSSAFAAVAWPGDLTGWTPIAVGDAYYNGTQPTSDMTWGALGTGETEGGLDVVGGDLLVSGTTPTFYPAGYTASDGTDLMFRMRLEDLPKMDAKSVWAVLFETNNDANLYTDFALRLELSNDGSLAVRLSATPGNYGPTNNWGTNPGGLGPDLWSGDGTYSGGLFPTGDGSNFGDDDDAFVDLAVPLEAFKTATGLGTGDSFLVAFATSSNFSNLNKDKPDAWSPPNITPVPEPASVTLLVMGALVALFRRRR